jgi:hypothetical protein
VQFRSSFDQSPLPLTQEARNQSNRRNRENGDVTLIVSVKIARLCLSDGSENMRMMMP